MQHTFSLIHLANPWQMLEYNLAIDIVEGLVFLVRNKDVIIAFQFPLHQFYERKIIKLTSKISS